MNILINLTSIVFCFVYQWFACIPSVPLVQDPISSRYRFPIADWKDDTILYFTTNINVKIKRSRKLRQFIKKKKKKTIPQLTLIYHLPKIQRRFVPCCPCVHPALRYINRNLLSQNITSLDSSRHVLETFR